MKNSYLSEKYKKTYAVNNCITYKKSPVITSIVFPVFFLLKYKNFEYKNPEFLYFSFITINASAISILFWLDPVQNKNKLIHKIDAITARFVLSNYALYKIFINQTNIELFFTSYILMLLFFYLSNKFSTMKWCSRKHINSHINAHLYSIVCFLIVLNDIHNPFYEVENSKKIIFLPY